MEIFITHSHSAKVGLLFAVKHPQERRWFAQQRDWGTQMKFFSGQIHRALMVAALFGVIANILMLAVPLYALQVMDRVLASRSLDTLLVLTLGVLVCLAMSAILLRVKSRIFSRAALMVEQRLTPELVGREIRAIASRNEPDLEFAKHLKYVSSFINKHGLSAATELMLVPLFLFLVVLVDLRMGAALGVLLLLLALCIPLQRWVMRKGEESIELQGRIDDARHLRLRRLANVMEVLGLTSRVVHNIQQSRDRELKERLSQDDRVLRVESFSRFVSLMVNVTLIGLGAYLASADLITPGQIIACLIIGMRTVSPLDGYIRAQQSIFMFKRSRKLISEVMQNSAYEAPGLPIISQPEAGVRMQDVVFSHGPGLKPIVAGVTMQIRPGSCIGLVGANGVGKTTFAKLVLGLYRPTAGQVRLGELDVSQVSRALLGPHLGYLDQAAELFPATIADNISRFEPAPIDEVIAAAKRVGAHEMIEQLPQGYETRVQGNGQNLSGGQRQMVCLARAIYGKPSLVVLDEPSSMLDGREATKVGLLLEQLKQEGVTTLVISHDKRLLRYTSTQLELQGGQIRRLENKPNVQPPPPVEEVEETSNV